MYGGVAAVLAVAVGFGVWLWGGRWAGAARQDLEGLQAVALGPDEQMWVGTGSALLRLKSSGAPERSDLPGGVRQILVDPGNPSQIYVLSATGRIHQSRDGGRTWSQTRGHGLPENPIRTFAYDPSGPTRLVALVSGHGYYQSDLSGDMWMPLSSQDIPDATALAVNPLDPRSVLAGGTGGLYLSPNQGMRFEAAGTSYPWSLRGAVHSLAVSGDRSSMLAATEHGVFRSRDGGRSWSALADTGLPNVVSVAYAPGRTRVILAGDRSGALALSRDGGQNWQPAK